MLPKGCTVLIGVSGGKDSMCLLHILLALSKTEDFSIAVAHFNHRLRGIESDGDEAFVSEYCKKLGISCHIGSGDVIGEAKRLGTGTEDASRKMRYDFFEKTAYSIGADRIATAHNADDNVETVLLHLTRGAGLKGLCGIPPVRGNIIRPLLPLPRSEIDKYLSDNGIPHREDSSNSGDDYSRNKIRHHVMPILREINPGVSKTVFSTSMILAEDEKVLSGEAKAFLDSHLEDGALPINKLSALPRAVACRVIKLFYGTELDSSHVDDVLDLTQSVNPSGEISLPKGTIRREYDRLLLGSAENITFSPFELSPGESRIIPELRFRVTCSSSKKAEEIHNSLTTFFFKCDSICGKVRVRPRLSGDKIKLSSDSGTKTLKKLFIERKIPRHIRSRLCVIADDLGPLAVSGIGADMRAIAVFGLPALKVTIEEITEHD